MFKQNNKQITNNKSTALEIKFKCKKWIHGNIYPLETNLGTFPKLLPDFAMWHTYVLVKDFSAMKE